MTLNLIQRTMTQLCSGIVLALMLTAGIGCSGNQSGTQMVDDAAVTTQIKSKLAADVQLSTLTDVEINTTNGVVTMAGVVSNADIKSRAEEIAKSVTGVRSVNNNLQVQGQTPSAP